VIIACGIDPAAHYGIAIVRYPGDDVLLSYHGRDPTRGMHLLQMCLKTNPKVIAIEDQWAVEAPKMGAKERRGRLASTIKVAHRAGEWAGVARAYGWPQATYVKPQTWRAAYKRTGRVPGAKRWAKGDAITWANALFRLELGEKEHDLAEALLIARWAAVRAYQGEQNG
jgi:hypothetical protein